MPDMTCNENWIEARNMSASKVGKLRRFKTAEADGWDRRGVASEEQGASE